MYSRVCSIIKHNHQLSNVITSNLGVKQGDPSSSLLFMMFVNDIVTSINTDLDGIFSTGELKLFLILFADDQVLFSTSPTSLQLMLNDVETYCNACGLKINVAKTKALIFEKSTRHSHYDFFLYNEKLEIVTSFKYLGVTFLRMEIGTDHKSVLQNTLQKQCIGCSLSLVNMSLKPPTNVNYLTLLFYKS